MAFPLGRRDRRYICVLIMYASEKLGAGERNEVKLLADFRDARIHGVLQRWIQISEMSNDRWMDRDIYACIQFSSSSTRMDRWMGG
jgi:hypothetical protein